MKKKIISVLSAAVLAGIIPAITLPTAANAAAGLIAFPGAEGAGKYATGGRGGTVYHVTNLNDSGSGSFRDAVSGSNRIVVFDVGGTITLKSPVIVKSNVTILGQTAPGGGGITLSGDKLAQGGSNQIIRYVSSRPGERGSGEYDAWGGSDGSNSIIDHCSIGWANDEQWGLYSNNTNQTVQYSIIGPSNCISTHAKGAHGFGIMFGSYNITWHHNMVAHNISRNFRGKVGSGNPADFVNNVIYDWGYQTAYGTLGSLNYVGNYLKRGPSTKGGNRFFVKSSGSSYELMKFYVAGNRLVNSDDTDYSGSIVSDNWVGVNGFDYSTYGSSTPFAVKDINGNNASVAANAESADDAYAHVLAYAGAGIDSDSRPMIDRQVMEEARTGTGSLTGGRDFAGVTDSDQLSAISKYNIKECDYESYYPSAVSKTITDTDGDGMPDDWELQRGLDPNKNDAGGDYLGRGYMNIEYYANDLTVNSFPEGVVEESPTSVDLGPEYTAIKEDLAALKLNTSSIKTAAELTLPQTGSVHGLDIVWSSSSSAIKIKNNVISSVSRGAEDKQVTLTAVISAGDYTMNKSFSVTVISNNTFWRASKNVTAGEELMDGLYPVSDMSYSAAEVTLNGTDFSGYVLGTDSGGFSNGAATGTAFKYTAAENGFITAYIRALGSETNVKTAYINEEGASSKNDCITSVSGNGNSTYISAQVEGGKTYYIFVSGSKGQFLGIEFSKTAKPVWWKASAAIAAGDELMSGLTSSGEFSYSDTSKTIDGEEFTGRVNGTANPSDNGAAGAALKYVPSSDGEFSVYSKVGSGKTLQITDINGDIVSSYKNEGDVSEYTSLSCDMESGKTYYMYVDGSKAELYGVSFTAVYTDETGDEPIGTPTAAPSAKPTSAPTATPTAAPLFWKASADVAEGSVLMENLVPMESMTYKAGEITIGGESFTGAIAGTNNPSFSDGVVTDGSALKYTPSKNGTLTVYALVGKPGSSGNKSLFISDGKGNITAQYENTSEEDTAYALSAAVTAGETYYMYVRGSRAKMYGVKFVQSEDTPEMNPYVSFDADSFTPGGSVTVTAVNAEGKDVYVAQYDINGVLVGLHKATADSTSFKCTVTSLDNTKAVKAMIWDNISPVANAAELTQ